MSCTSTTEPTGCSLFCSVVIERWTRPEGSSEVIDHDRASGASARIRPRSARQRELGGVGVGRGEQLAARRAGGGAHDALVAGDPRQRVLDARAAIRPLAVEAVVGGGDGEARAQRQIVLEPAAHHPGEQRVADPGQHRQPSHEHQEELRRPTHRIRICITVARWLEVQGWCAIQPACRSRTSGSSATVNSQLMYGATARSCGAACPASTPRRSSGRCSTRTAGSSPSGRPRPAQGLQRYLANTNVLETRFESPEGAFRVLDFAPRFLQFERSFRPTKLVRVVEPLAGTPRIRVSCDPRAGLVQGAAAPRGRLAPHQLSRLSAPKCASRRMRRCPTSTASRSR